MVRRAALLVAILLLATLGADDYSVAQTTAARKFSADDYVEIQQLYATYAQSLDRGEGERFAATFTEDGEYVGGRGAGHGGKLRTPKKGRNDLVKLGSIGGRRHFTANLVITPTPDGAEGSCYLSVYDITSIPAVLLETAIYDDTLVKTSQGWRFKRRVVWRDDDDLTPFKPRLRPLPVK